MSNQLLMKHRAIIAWYHNTYNNVVAFNENLPEESQTNYQCSHLLQGINVKVMCFQL